MPPRRSHEAKEEEEEEEEKEVLSLHAAAASRRKRQPLDVIPVTAQVSSKRRKGCAQASRAGAVNFSGFETPIFKFPRVDPFPAERWSELSDDCMRVFELALPAELLYSSTPTTFFAMTGHADTVNVYKQLLTLFGYLANQVCAERVTKDPETNAVMRIQSENRVMVTFERVPHRDDARRTVMFRLRLTEQSAARNFGMTGDLKDWVARCQRQILDAQQKVGGGGGGYGRRHAAIQPWCHSRINRSRYTELCDIYAPKVVEQLRQTLRENDLSSYHCAYNPEKVFSIHHSLKAALGLGADPRYCDATLYRSYDQATNVTSFGFADPSNVWLLDAASLEPLELHRLFLPTVCADRMPNLQMAALYERMHGPGAAELFHRKCNTTSASSVENDIKALTETTAHGRKELRDQHGTSNAYFVAHQAKQLEWLKTLGEIIHVDGNVAESMKCIRRFMDAYLHENDKTFCLTRRMTTRNLTRLGDLLAQLANADDTIAGVNRAHKECLVYKLCALHVYYRVPMNPHCLLLGPPGLGKSFALRQLYNMFIAGTVDMIQTVTPRALAVPGKVNDARVLIFEDAPASILGVGGMPGGPSSDIVNMMKQFLTSMTTELKSMRFDENGRRVNDIVYAETSCVCFFAMNEPSSAFPDAILSRCNTVVNAAFDYNAKSGGDSVDRPTVQAKTSRSSAAPVKEAYNDVRTYWHRTQSLVACIFYGVASGALRDINMEAADFFFSMVGQHAGAAHHLNMTDQRKWERFRAIVRVLTVISAIDLVWDMPGSPFAGLEHSDQHFLELEKHLVATVEIAIFAIGLLSNEWQNNLRAQIVEAMVKWFPDRQERLDALTAALTDEVMEVDIVEPQPPQGCFVPSREQVHPGPGRKPSDQVAKALERPDVRDFVEQRDFYDGLRDSRKNWAYATAPMGTEHLPTFRGGGRNGFVNANSSELIAHVARQLMPKLTPRPLESEVQAILFAMTNEMQECTRYVFNGARTECLTHPEPVLVVEQERLRLNLTTIRHASATDPLAKAVTEVATSLYEARQQATLKAGLEPLPPEQTYLYGETEPNAPHVWRQIVARPEAATADTRAKLRRVANPHYFEAAQIQLARGFLAALNGGDDSNRCVQLFQADRPWADIDMDLDAYAAQQHATDLGLCAEVQHEWPSNDHHRTDASLRAHFSAREPLLDYPQCFERRNKEAWRAKWDQRARLHPGEFNLSTRYEEMLALQHTRARLPPLPYRQNRTPPPAAQPAQLRQQSAPPVVVSQYAAAAASDSSDDDDVEMRQQQLREPPSMVDIAEYDFEAEMEIEAEMQQHSAASN